MTTPMINSAHSGCHAGAPSSGCHDGHGHGDFKADRNGLEGLGSELDRLFSHGQQEGFDPETIELLTDIRDMLSKFLEKKEGGDCGCEAMPHEHETPETMDEPDRHACDGAKPQCGGAHDPEAEEAEEADDHACGAAEEEAEETACGAVKPHDCGDGDEAEWDGTNKSPSLDRERAAVRFLEQAQNTDDLDQKRELVNMAMDMLGEPDSKKGDVITITQLMKDRAENSYDKDIVKQAERMLETIDDGKLDAENEAQMLDSVIDMLMKEGGVDGKPASGDTDGNGWDDRWDDLRNRPLPTAYGIARDHLDDH